MCDVGRRVENHKCEPCGLGKYNTEKHDASGEDTECKSIICDENEYVRLVINVLHVRLELITPQVIWQMVQLQPAMLLFAMKITMYKTINVKNVRVKDTMMLEMMLVVQIRLVKH